jgi:hypothetical protein
MRLDSIRTKKVFDDVRLGLMLGGKYLQHGGLQKWANDLDYATRRRVGGRTNEDHWVIENIETMSRRQKKLVIRQS